MDNSRRDFLRKSAIGTAGITIGGLGMSASSYARIIGANDRLNVVFMGCGRRVNAYYNAVFAPENNARLAYICDVMDKQNEKVMNDVKDRIDYKPVIEKDIRKILQDKDVDVIFNATPDHWHAPGTWMALEAGKHVYNEKPSSHNPFEDEVVLAYQKKYGKLVQMGNQQRSSIESIQIINEMHNGAIGDIYKAIAFYFNDRGPVPLPVDAPPPEGLDWELFQGPAPRVDYQHDTWNYNWHWYGWNWGTAESGNNATHEVDIARWAIQGNYPELVYVEADKNHFKDDGWVMYDTMEATLIYPGGKIIKWDGKSRNASPTYENEGRGTILYGTEGSVHMGRGGYKLFDRGGKLVKEIIGESQEAGTALGGGGDMSTRHVVNFFESIRGKDTLNAPIEDGAKSVLMIHLINIAYRVGRPIKIDPKTGYILDDPEAMALWKRDYEPGWEPKI